MKKQRLAKRIRKQAKKDKYKQELKALQKECGNDVDRYRLEKGKLQKQYGYIQ